METTTRHTMMERPHREMREKSHLRDTFFSLKHAAEPRPDSVHTEFMETDWDEDDILSDGDDGDVSPRLSINSSGQPSFTTLSSYEEAHTPESARARSVYRFDMGPDGPDPSKAVVGPRGPHLFRSSVSTTNSLEFQNALSLSPITPRVAHGGGGKIKETEFQLPIALDVADYTPRAPRDGPFQFTSEELDTAGLAQWCPEKVAQWMLNAGVELMFAEKFVENDINGAILITLKFEDLKELGIASFGVRTKIWEQIHVMKDIRAASPAPETPIEDEPSREVKKEQRKQQEGEGGKMRRRPSSRRRRQQNPEDNIRPQESVSIVGIEQMMPKPHQCSKGESCRKFKRNQRMIEAFKKDHPFVDMDKGGVIMIAGDPGNPETAEALRRTDDTFRPVSDAVPSVVASSDVMGTEGIPPLQYLQEATLRNIQARDPQDNVRQFLDFQQHVSGEETVPPTPPFEMLPARKQPHDRLKSLAKLSIPSQASRPVAGIPDSACPGSAYPQTAVQQQYIQRQAAPPSPSPSPEGQTPTGNGVYRFGTPFSDMDVPLTAVNLGPVARDTSQSVPPEMNYHSSSNPPPRSLSRSTFRRPSFQAMPSLDENMVTPIAPRRNFIPSPIKTSNSGPQQRRPLQPPPRVQWPWSPPATERKFETAIAPIPRQHSPNHTPGSSSSSSSASNAAATGGPSYVVTPLASSSTTQSKESSSSSEYQYQGLMKKRKTKMLRHEWHDQYVTLKGTRLAMHKPDPAAVVDRALEYVDIDDYAIACSSMQTSSKLNAAFKAMSISRSSHHAASSSSGSKDDIAAFAFQLIPQDARGGVRLLRKRESLGAHQRQNSDDGVNGTGKTHHFAVKSRDDRIDWMREMMLAKALKQKGEGFEVSVNGNMI